MRLFPGKININIKTVVPTIPVDPNWLVKGQTISLTVDSRMTVSQLKETLSPMLGGMSTSKLRLR